MKNHMRKTYLFFFAIILILASGCGESKEKKADKISTLEKQLYASAATGFNKAKADSLLSLYESYVQKYPKDSLAPKYQFQAAGLAMTLGNGKKSLELYGNFIKLFPENPKVPVCMFFTAYIYENMIMNLEKAREIYLNFIEKYPNNDFVKDAQVALENLGKTPEQLVREFELKQKEQEARKADSMNSLSSKKKKPSGKKN